MCGAAVRQRQFGHGIDMFYPHGLALLQRSQRAGCTQHHQVSANAVHARRQGQVGSMLHDRIGPLQPRQRRTRPREGVHKARVRSRMPRHHRSRVGLEGQARRLTPRGLRPPVPHSGT